MRFACETVSVEPPVLVTTIAWEDVVVAGMLLKVIEVGDTEMVGGGSVTVTDAVADFVVSATLVARTVNVPATAGAVYKPAVETVPPVADHVTAVFEVPVTVAVNCCVPPV